MALISLTDTSSGASFSLDSSDIIKIYDKDSQTVVEYVSGELSRNVSAKVDGAVATVAALASNVFATTYLGGTIYLNSERIISVEEVSSKAWVTYDNNGDKPELLKLDVDKSTFEASIVSIDGSVPIGGTIIVSSEGVTVANGAQKDDFVAHYSDLSEAIAASDSTDNIIVYPGADYDAVGNMVGDYYSITFMPGTFVTGASYFDDGGTANALRVFGHGNFSVSGDLVTLTNASSTLLFEAESAFAGDRVFDIQSGIDFHGSVFDKIEGGDSTIYLAGAAQGVIDCPRIVGNTTAGNVTVDVRASFSGNVVINCKEMTVEGLGATVISSEDAAGSGGTLTVNVEDEILGQGSAAAVLVQSSSLQVNINGNINGADGEAIRGDGQGGAITVKGNITNDGSQPLGVFEPANLTTYRLEGEFSSSNVVLFQMTSGTAPVLVLNGRATSTSTSASQKQIVTCNAGALIVEDLIAVLDGGAGTPAMIYGANPINVRVYKSVSNYANDANITNIITGALEVVDTDVL